MLTLNLDDDFRVGSGVLDSRVLKAEGTWLVIVKNGDFANAINIVELCTVFKQFNKEVFIGFVTIVVHNSDIDVLAFLARFECEGLVDGLIIVRRSGGIIAGLNLN